MASPTRGAFGFSKVVFLSHVNSPEMPRFPGDPEVVLRTAATHDRDGFYQRYLAIAEQSGTHWAAPVHFDPNGLRADELDAADFFHPAAVVDVRRYVRNDIDFTLEVEHLEEFETKIGPIPPDALVLLWTGFSERWAAPTTYLNADEAGVLHYPGFGLEATRWLVEQRRAAGLGIDTLGIDPGVDLAYRSNRLLLGDRRIHLENLTGLAAMPPLGGWIVVGGLRNLAGSGSPATVFGLIP